MGYRSEVGIAINPEVFDNAPDNVKGAFAEIFGLPEDKDDVRVLFHHDYIKWYVDFDQPIKTIMDWLEALDEETYGFIELGEDDSDITIYGNPNEFGLSCVRKLEF